MLIINSDLKPHAVTAFQQRPFIIISLSIFDSIFFNSQLPQPCHFVIFLKENGYKIQYSLSHLL